MGHISNEKEPFLKCFLNNFVYMYNNNHPTMSGHFRSVEEGGDVLDAFSALFGNPDLSGLFKKLNWLPTPRSWDVNGLGR